MIGDGHGKKEVHGKIVVKIFISLFVRVNFKINCVLNLQTACLTCMEWSQSTASLVKGLR